MVQSAEDFVQNDFKVTPEVCQEILAGTFDSLGTPQSQDLFHEANALSEHKGTKGMGHLDPQVTGPRGLSGPFPWYLCAAPRVHWEVPRLFKVPVSEDLLADLRGHIQILPDEVLRIVVKLLDEAQRLLHDGRAESHGCRLHHPQALPGFLLATETFAAPHGGCKAKGTHRVSVAIFDLQFVSIQRLWRSGQLLCSRWMDTNCNHNNTSLLFICNYSIRSQVLRSCGLFDRLIWTHHGNYVRWISLLQNRCYSLRCKIASEWHLGDLCKNLGPLRCNRQIPAPQPLSWNFRASGSG